MDNKAYALLVSNNLMFLPRIEAAAGSTMAVKRALTVDDASNLLDTLNIKFVLIDLEFEEQVWTEVLKSISTGNKKPEIIAYGPHENTQLMDLAISLGCKEALPKGVFVNRLRRILHPEKN